MLDFCFEITPFSVNLMIAVCLRLKKTFAERLVDVKHQIID